MQGGLTHQGSDHADADPQLTVQIQEDYVHAQAVGRRTRRAVGMLTAGIGREAIDHGVHKVLIDVRQLEGWLGVFDSYYVVRDDFGRLRGRGIEMAAIIDRPAGPFRERFFELTARNRGFNLRIFESLEAAREWLRGG